MAGLRIGCSTSTYFNIISTFKAFEWPHLPTVVMRTWRNSLKNLWSSHCCRLGRGAGVPRCCFKECNSCHAKEHERTNSLCCLQCLLSKPAIRSCETSLDQQHTASYCQVLIKVLVWGSSAHCIKYYDLIFKCNIINDTIKIYHKYNHMGSFMVSYGCLCLVSVDFIHRTPWNPRIRLRHDAISPSRRLNESPSHVSHWKDGNIWKHGRLETTHYSWLVVEPPTPSYPSEKYNMSSSVGMMTFPTEWKNNPFMFQTTNQAYCM